MVEKWKVFFGTQRILIIKKGKRSQKKPISFFGNFRFFLSKLLVSRNITNPEEADIF